MRAQIAGVMMLVCSAATPAHELAHLDRNGDRAVSRIEALGDGEIYKRFATFDADNDGILSQPEYARAVEDNRKRIVRDSLVTARVKAALLAAKGIPSRHIAVQTYEGRVYLKGFVGAAEIASRAGRVTAAVDGVRTVHNDLAVK
jgi:hypothetical protein